MQSTDRIGYSFPRGTTVILRHCQGAYYLPPDWTEGTRATVVAIHGQEYEVEAKGRRCRVSHYCLHYAPVESPAKPSALSAPAPRHMPAPLKKPDWLVYGEQLREELNQRAGTPDLIEKVEASFREACNKGYKGTLSDWYYLIRDQTAKSIGLMGTTRLCFESATMKEDYSRQQFSSSLRFIPEPSWAAQCVP